MKIYFEDGKLLAPAGIPFAYDYVIDAKEGYSFCDSALSWILKNAPDSVVYTNFVEALSNTYAWNRVDGAPDIYIRRNNGEEFVRIDTINGHIRYAQNIAAMYRSGFFGNVDTSLTLF